MDALKSDVEVRHSEDLGVKFDPRLIDCSISELGKKQALQAGEQLKDINVTLVFTSPLRRCLDTTYYIFKDHKNKPKVIVWPLIKEMLLSNCDTSDHLETIKKEFPDYDFSHIDALPHPELWLLYMLKNETLAHDLIDELFRKYPNKEEAFKNYPAFLNEKVKNAYPNLLEHPIELNQRTLEAKKALIEMSSKHKDGEFICVVAHSRFLESLSAERYEENGLPVNAKWFANCEVVPYKLE